MDNNTGMQVFGRCVPTPDDIWDTYGMVVQKAEIWHSETFKEAAEACGLRKIAARRGYFGFAGKHHITGQAIIAEGFIEELRLFIAQEPRDLPEEMYKQDKDKIVQVASGYSARLKRELGAPRTANGNDIFECNDHRIRVLPTNCVWVVISNLSIIRRLSRDHWLPE